MEEDRIKGVRSWQISLYSIFLAVDILFFSFSVHYIARFGEELSQFENLYPLLLSVFTTTLSINYVVLGVYFTWINDYKARLYHIFFLIFVGVAILVTGIALVATQIGISSISVDFFFAAFSVCCDFEVADEILLFCNETFEGDLCLQEDNLERFKQFQDFLVDTERNFCNEIENEISSSNCDPTSKNSFINDVAFIFLKFWYPMGGVLLFSLIIRYFNFTIYNQETGFFISDKCNDNFEVNEMRRVEEQTRKKERNRNNDQALTSSDINADSTSSAPEQVTDFDKWRLEFQKRKDEDKDGKVSP